MELFARWGRVRAGLLLVTCLVGLGGCGGGAKPLSTQAGDQLHADIESIRAAVSRDQDSTALAAVNAFRARVRDLANSGDLAADDALVLLTRADRIAAAIGPSSTAAPTSSPDPVVLAPASGPDGRDEPPGHAKDKDKHKGKGPKDD